MQLCATRLANSSMKDMRIVDNCSQSEVKSDGLAHEPCVHQNLDVNVRGLIICWTRFEVSSEGGSKHRA